MTLISNLTTVPVITSGSGATTGLFNNPLGVLERNIQQINTGVWSTGSITVESIDSGGAWVNAKAYGSNPDTALTAIGTSPEVLLIPADFGVNQPTTIPDNVVVMDFRPQRYGSNDTHYAINIHRGDPTVRWDYLNTSGLARSTLYVATYDSHGSFPGVAAAMFHARAYAGTLAADQTGAGMVNVASTHILSTTTNSDSLTNRAFLNGSEHEVILDGKNILVYDARALTANILTALIGPDGPTGTVGQLITLAAQGLTFFPASGLSIARAITLDAEYPGLTAVQNRLVGRMTSSGFTATWVSGNKFADRGMVGYPIVFSGSTYTVDAVSNSTTMRLSPAPGTISNSTWTLQGSQYGARIRGTAWFDPQSTDLADPNGGYGVIIDTDGLNANRVITIRDSSVRAGDGTFTRKYIRVVNDVLQVVNRAFTANILTLNDSGDLTVGSNGGGYVRSGTAQFDVAAQFLSRITVTNSDSGNTAGVSLVVRAGSGQSGQVLQRWENASGVTRFAVSDGTVDLNQSRLLSVRTLATSAITVSAANTNVRADELVLTIGGASGASLCIHSGGTVYIFNSAISAKAT